MHWNHVLGVNTMHQGFPESMSQLSDIVKSALALEALLKTSDIEAN